MIYAVAAGFADVEQNSVLLRFSGQRSSLLLIWPTVKNDPMLLRYPYYACASGENWGKVTRGIVASWSLSEGEHSHNAAVS